MMDQAQKLRQIVEGLRVKREAQELKKARVITVTSGKGGVGKTNFTINCAIALQKMGYRVVIIDADFGLANIDVMLGIIPKYDLGHVLRKDKNLEEAMADGPCGIRFLSGGSGVWELLNLSPNDLELFIEKLQYLDEIADIIMIDTGAGVSENVLKMIMAANEVIIMVTPEPTAITDAYALVKTTVTMNKNSNLKLIVNKAENHYEAQGIINKFTEVAERFLDIQLEPLGYMLNDTSVPKSVKKQKPFILEYPKCHATKQVLSIAHSIVAQHKSVSSKGQGIKSYIHNLVHLVKTKNAIY
jgi:flagellar biosynthesis protein FlhG